MATQKKIDRVAYLTDVLSRSTVAVGTEYRGLKVHEITSLRRTLRDAGIEMHVVKNTLFRRAADAAGKSDMHPIAEGPTALVLGFGDPIAPIKTLVEYQRTARNAIVARSAYIEGQIIAGPRLAEVATLPSKDTMLAEFAGSLMSPVSNLIGLLQATMQEFVGLLDARAEQMA
jgi:large subunit ribosomal protein L10